MNRYRLWWPILTSVVVVVTLAILVNLVGHALDPDDRVNIADLMAIALAAVALAAPVVLWAKRVAAPAPPMAEETVAAAKEALIRLVTEQWRTEATIRSLGDPEPIPISWHLADASLMDHPRLVGKLPLTFTAASDQIPDLVDCFRALRRSRLVITGGPGSGKTTLAVQLLLELGEGSGRHLEDPVPVLLTISGWDTTVQPRLHDWLAIRLAQDYPALTAPALGSGAAKTLVDRGHILPILDGLDELPGPARAAVITALNGSLADRDQFILTSRTGELAAAIKEAGDVLTAAAVIAPRPLTPHAAADYLHTCLPPHRHHDWTPALNALRNANPPGLAEVASTALGLWLIRTVYITAVTNPAPLTGPLGDDPAAMRAHLLDHLIPATIRARTPTRDPAEHFRPRTAWNPDQARRYLAYLARLLTAQGTHDLAWWQLARQTTTKAQQRRIALAVGAMSGILLLLLLGLGVGLAFGLAFGLTSGLRLAFVAGWFTQTPGYADLRLRGRITNLIKHIVRNLPFALALALALAFVAVFIFMRVLGFEVVPEAGLTFGLVLALAIGLAAGLVEWAEQPASATTATTPESSWKADRTLTLLRTIAFGLTAGLTSGLAIGVVFGPVAGPAAGLTVGLTAGHVLGLRAGDHHAWLAYKITAWRLTTAGYTPRNLMAFLNDTHRLGLLRAVGPIYQFRHADLHDHLAALPSEQA